MNPRIREFAEQAGLKVESWMTNPPKPFQILGSTEQFEKFAELIIRECLSVTKKQYNDTLPWGGVEDTIKEHFGVE
jgi:hypothetical protein